MNNQALVDALIKFQNWCDEWPKIKDHIDALTAEVAKLRERVAELEKQITARDRHEGEVFVNYHRDMGRA